MNPMARQAGNYFKIFVYILFYMMYNNYNGKR